MTNTPAVVTTPTDACNISNNKSISSNITTSSNIGIGISSMGSSAWSANNLDLKQNEDMLKVMGRLAEIEKRLAILAPNEELQAKFPSLKEAYDHYKLVEQLVGIGGI